MIWPPLKAWTCKNYIDGQQHFVSINYGGELQDRWVLLMSVLDSRVVVNVNWSQLVDSSKWECGWHETNYLNFPELVNNKCKSKNTKCANPSIDSGLTIPITKNIIRPWFRNI
tara:strand:+ start:250 stop:588 length:339 start_codon:yes stop_codon:yes gene_type:complete